METLFLKFSVQTVEAEGKTTDFFLSSLQRQREVIIQQAQLVCLLVCLLGDKPERYSLVVSGPGLNRGSAFRRCVVVRKRRRCCV